jgi:hypothetical protein
MPEVLALSPDPSVPITTPSGWAGVVFAQADIEIAINARTATIRAVDRVGESELTVLFIILFGCQ